MIDATPFLSRAATMAAIMALCGCVSTHVVAPTSAAQVGNFRPGILNGYLDPRTLPDTLALLAAPPAPGSAAQAADEAAYQELTKFQGTPRGAIAVRDANLGFPTAPNNFSCALGIVISEQDTPNLQMLLRRSLTDAALSTYKAKDQYQRTRPFVVHDSHSCTPASDPSLAKDGSYPSGHTTIGWTWALLLTEIAPDRSDALLQRGRSFGQSRGICGAHWKSDIDAGRIVGAATVARLHADPVFLAQMAAARSEIEQARSKGATPTADCAAEAAALKETALLAP
jgi:acid phosphatase (class A)